MSQRVSTPCEAVSTRDISAFVPGYLELYCRCMEGFLIGGWDFILPGWRWVILALYLLEKNSSLWHGQYIGLKSAKKRPGFILKQA